MAQQDLEQSLNLPMLVTLGAAGILGTSWVYTARRRAARGGLVFA